MSIYCLHLRSIGSCNVRALSCRVADSSKQVWAFWISLRVQFDCGSRNAGTSRVAMPEQEGSIYARPEQGFHSTSHRPFAELPGCVCSPSHCSSPDSFSFPHSSMPHSRSHFEQQFDMAFNTTLSGYSTEQEWWCKKKPDTLLPQLFPPLPQLMPLTDYSSTGQPSQVSPSSIRHGACSCHQPSRVLIFAKTDNLVCALVKEGLASDSAVRQKQVVPKDGHPNSSKREDSGLGIRDHPTIDSIHGELVIRASRAHF
ncbi:hypothetical protein B0O80DRAFT_116608 [Mortierella sp. GBAus27b]|nr:hypothetical protein B0O80DRAFT_116608 [Mortierella sp. GBAus27b]